MLCSTRCCRHLWAPCQLGEGLACCPDVSGAVHVAGQHLVPDCQADEGVHRIGTLQACSIYALQVLLVVLGGRVPVPLPVVQLRQLVQRYACSAAQQLSHCT